MFKLLDSLAVPAALDRVLLALNHVVAAEPAAVARLRPHAGRRLRVGWQVPVGPWPRPPEIALAVTPAGLFERLDAELGDVFDLRVQVELQTPAALLASVLAGERPRVDVEGDAALAADVGWLAEHLSWDVEYDLERLIGPVPARELARFGRLALGSVRQGAQALAGAWERHPGAASR